jgi:hypothetical protein
MLIPLSRKLNARFLGEERALIGGEERALMGGGGAAV